jgi:hypothetical protein
MISAERFEPDPFDIQWKEAGKSLETFRRPTQHVMRRQIERILDILQKTFSIGNAEQKPPSRLEKHQGRVKKSARVAKMFQNLKGADSVILARIRCCVTG